MNVSAANFASSSTNANFAHARSTTATVCSTKANANYTTDNANTDNGKLSYVNFS